LLTVVIWFALHVKIWNHWSHCWQLSSQYSVVWKQLLYFCSPEQFLFALFSCVCIVMQASYIVTADALFFLLSFFYLIARSHWIFTLTSPSRKQARWSCSVQNGLNLHSTFLGKSELQSKHLSVKCLPGYIHSHYPARLPRRLPFTKHLSFDQICEVATIEHNKLSSSEGNNLAFLVLNLYLHVLAVWYYMVFRRVLELIWQYSQ